MKKLDKSFFTVSEIIALTGLNSARIRQAAKKSGCNTEIVNSGAGEKRRGVYSKKTLIIMLKGIGYIELKTDRGVVLAKSERLIYL